MIRRYCHLQEFKFWYELNILVIQANLCIPFHHMEAGFVPPLEQYNTITNGGWDNLRCTHVGFWVIVNVRPYVSIKYSSFATHQLIKFNSKSE